MTQYAISQSTSRRPLEAADSPAALPAGYLAIRTVLDFGVAKVRSAATLAGGTAEAVSLFTPAYGAPEQWKPATYGEAGPWTDVWGLALSAVEAISDRVAVLYRGQLCEIGPTDAVYADPQHAYTLALLDASLGWREEGAPRHTEAPPYVSAPRHTEPPQHISAPRHTEPVPHASAPRNTESMPVIPAHDEQGDQPAGSNNPAAPSDSVASAPTGVNVAPIAQGHHTEPMPAF